MVFVLEVLIKTIAYGFLLNGDESYLRKPSNIFDFMVVIFSVFGAFGTNIPAFKVMRLLRVLRPLRVISKNQGL